MSSQSTSLEFREVGKKKKGLSAGAITGIIIAVLVIIALVILLSIFLTTSSSINSASEGPLTSLQPALIDPNGFNANFQTIPQVTITARPNPGINISSAEAVAIVDGISYPSNTLGCVTFGENPFQCFFVYPTFSNILTPGKMVQFQVTVTSDDMKTQTRNFVSIVPQ